MNSQPTFSVLIPTYNQASYLNHTLDSLLAQTDGDWEAVVVNDGSTDSTAEVMQSYADSDPRIRIFHKQNGGVSTALNEGLRQARGAWICWLSSDDLFDPRKLEIHRQQIERNPETSFFHTHFYKLYEEDNRLESPPHWRAIPDPEWQVIELFRGNFINGISICIRREAMEITGEFDESLRYAQDYDMWLRLLVRYPAVFIPERTCIQRSHAGQTTHTFPEALHFDSSRAVINLLNRCTFEQLLPLVDLSDPAQAKNAIERALDIATTYVPKSLYGIGPHQALLWRILEWAYGPNNHASTPEIWALIENKALSILKSRHLDPAIRLQWKAIYAAIGLRGGNFEYTPLVVNEVVERRYWQLSADDKANPEALHRYLVRFGRTPDPLPSAVDPRLQTGEVVLVCHRGARVDNPIKYGAARAWVELSHYLMRIGRQVLVIGISEQRLGVTEGIPFLGVQTEEELDRVLRRLSPFDSLIGISRADIFAGRKVERPLVYQHSSHPPRGDYAITVIRRLKIPVVVVSSHSLNAELQRGIPKGQIHLARNGYSANVFRLNEEIARAPHRLIYAGNGVFDKGLDIAVQAFALLKSHFADAEFMIYGASYKWVQETKHLLPVRWLDAEGYPKWSTIEQELPGIKYCEEATQSELAEAFQRASLLIMPSRIAETFGLVSIEAQACGAIPVLPRHGGFPETMQEGVTGYLYDNNTPEDLAQVVSNLWEKNSPTEQQRRKAADWVQQTFSWQKTGQEITEIVGPLSPQKRHLLALESIFWETAMRGKARLRKTYRQIKSSLLQKPAKASSSLPKKNYL